MGCTSSAPSMASANATDRNIKFSKDTEEKGMDEINEMIGGVTQTKAIIENKVLPTCDTLDEPILLTQTDKSMLETASRRIDKDVQTDNYRIDNGHAWNESFKILQEENTPKLEEVVERAVEMSHTENAEGAHNTHEESTEDTGEMETEENSEEAQNAEEPEAEEENYEHLEGAISPSQSESSRATRWEALADIAAELPPSLAVDPLTGQIYSLSK